MILFNSYYFMVQIILVNHLAMKVIIHLHRCHLTHLSPRVHLHLRSCCDHLITHDLLWVVSIAIIQLFCLHLQDIHLHLLHWEIWIDCYCSPISHWEVVIDNLTKVINITLTTFFRVMVVVIQVLRTNLKINLERLRYHLNLSHYCWNDWVSCFNYLNHLTNRYGDVDNALLSFWFQRANHF